jgi:hypothetical protein
VEAEQEEIRYQVKNDPDLIGETVYRSASVNRLRMQLYQKTNILSSILGFLFSFHFFID